MMSVCACVGCVIVCVSMCVRECVTYLVLRVHQEMIASVRDSGSSDIQQSAHSCVFHPVFCRTLPVVAYRRLPRSAGCRGFPRTTLSVPVPCRYFPADQHQALPAQGYTELVKRMLNHPNIEVSPGAERQCCQTSARSLQKVNHNFEMK